MLGNVLLYISNSIWITFLAMAVFGLGFGFAVFSPIKNACFYCPEKKGLIAALITSIGNLGNAAYNYFGETLINSTNYTLKEGEKYYPFWIAKNVSRYYALIFVAIPVGTILGCLFIYQFVPDLKELQVPIISNLPNEIEEGNDKPRISPPKLPPPPMMKPLTEAEKMKYKKDISKVLHNKRIWILSAINFLASFLLLLVVNSYKTIGATAPTRVDAALLRDTAVFCAICLSGFGPLWGLLIDKVIFKIIFIIVNAIGTGVGIGLVFGLYIPILFCLLVCATGLCASGLTAVFNPHIMKVYGIQYSMIVAGIINLIGGMSNLIGSMFTFIVSTVYADNQNFAYGCVYIVGASMNFLAMLLTLWESNEPFEYDHIQDIETVGDMYDKERESRITEISH